LKKGGREGFLARPFQSAKALPNALYFLAILPGLIPDQGLQAARSGNTPCIFGKSIYFVCIRRGGHAKRVMAARKMGNHHAMA
jgi:hypothetical protein